MGQRAGGLGMGEARSPTGVEGNAIKKARRGGEGSDAEHGGCQLHYSSISFRPAARLMFCSAAFKNHCGEHSV